MIVNPSHVRPPIACSLSAAELPARLAEMSAVGRDALVDVELSDLSATLQFVASDDIDARLSAIVAAESGCCRFLRIDLHRSDERLTLTITAPRGAQPVLDDLVAAFSATAEA